MSALTTGWERDLAVDDTLARRFVFAYADRVAAMAARTGGRVREVDGARLVDLGSPFGYDNAVMLTRPLAEAEWPALLAAATTFFPPERWWVLLSMFAAPDLADHGLARVGHPPLMLRPPGPPPPPPRDLRIRVVDDAAALADFERVLIAGYGLAEVGTPAIADLALAGSLLHLFVGDLDGTPVATAGCAVHHGIVEIDWVATVPDARRRGFGAALTAAAVAVGPELSSLLIASDDGHGVYRQLGFLDLFRTTMWEHVPEAPGQ